MAVIMKKCLFFLLVLIYALQGFGQEKKLIQFTGRAFNEFVQPLAFTNIIIINRGRGTLSDAEGKFSFVAELNDTIIFSSMGYKKAIVIIPDTLKSKFYTRDILLQADTFMIAEVEVYQWKNYEEFKQAFLNLELPEDDLDRAQRNIALIKQQLLINDDPLPSSNFNYIMQQNTLKSFNRGTYPTYQVFNIMAWSKFFQALKNGDFKNDKK
jgi:hypothetical protein